jgi:hypothetical protein
VGFLQDAARGGNGRALSESAPDESSCARAKFSAADIRESSPVSPNTLRATDGADLPASPIAGAFFWRDAAFTQR